MDQGVQYDFASLPMLCATVCLHKGGAELLHTQREQLCNIRAEPTAEEVKQTLGYILLETMTTMLIQVQQKSDSMTNLSNPC